MRRFTVSAVLLAMMVSSPALACRVNLPAAVRVSSVRAAPDFGGVAVGVIEASTPHLDDTNEAQGWSATVRIRNTLEGRSTDTSYLIGRSGDSASCDDGQKMPEIGEGWVIYLVQRPTGSVAYLSYPLELVRRIDPQLKAAEISAPTHSGLSDRLLLGEATYPATRTSAE
jgi:hypothetical protein